MVEASLDLRYRDTVLDRTFIIDSLDRERIGDRRPRIVTMVYEDNGETFRVEKHIFEDASGFEVIDEDE